MPPHQRGPVPDQRAILCPCRDGHPEFKKRFTSSRDLTASAVVRRLSSVDVVEINLAGFGLGDPSARHNDAHEGEHDRRGENLLAGRELSWLCSCGPCCPPPDWQRVDSRCLLRSTCYPAGSEIFGLRQIAWTLFRHGHARPIARPNKRQRGGGFRDDM